MSSAKFRNPLKIKFAILILFLISESIVADEVSYSREVRPILAAKCFNCHGFDAGSRQGDLRLDKRESAQHVLSLLDGSNLLLDRITSDDPDVQMPPPESKLTLSAEEIHLLDQWLDQGAKYERHWAFQPPTRPEGSTCRLRQSS
jgi:hypothetical protein